MYKNNICLFAVFLLLLNGCSLLESDENDGVPDIADVYLKVKANPSLESEHLIYVDLYYMIDLAGSDLTNSSTGIHLDDGTTFLSEKIRTMKDPLGLGVVDKSQHLLIDLWFLDTTKKCYSFEIQVIFDEKVIKTLNGDIGRSQNDSFSCNEQWFNWKVDLPYSK